MNVPWGEPGRNKEWDVGGDAESLGGVSGKGYSKGVLLVV